eukprot:TRINITY_DN476_c0_g1_i1.p1 TRINITY_DN476_c0_g1~~TRINITY_DN476_c0_g1_i1.p1  ORF type:complete len:4333 (+),score=667.47 TRINITY_DN476_c0_g1_i1:7842-20840(+)
MRTATMTARNSSQSASNGTLTPRQTPLESSLARPLTPLFGIASSSMAISLANQPRWTTSQVELGRVITISQLGTLGQHIQDEKQKFFYVTLGESFKSHYGLTFKMDIDSEVKITPVAGMPSIRLSHQAIAKDCELDKQTVTYCLSNVFQLIGELLAEGRNVEIDLSPFGKLKGLKREVTFTPPVKKPAPHGKQTVKALFELNAGAGEERAQEEVKLPGIGDSSVGYEEKMMSPIKFGATTKGSQAEMSATSVYRSIQVGGLSPTRRFKKPEGSGQVTGSLLSAGVDPLGVSHEYSFLVKDTDRLMKTQFKRPPNAAARLPPVLDQFSRTIAAPITSQKHYFSVSHKIGTHYTISSRGLYIDPETRTVKYKTIETDGTKLNMMARSYVDPATEDEEYQAISQADVSLKYKVDARKRAYERYRAYIEQEIANEVVAPINNAWMINVTQKVSMKEPASDRTKEMLNEMFEEITRDYYTSVKKSILDYTLKNAREKERLGLPLSFLAPTDYGSKPFIGIEPSEEWRNNAVMGAIKMRDTLCVFNRATLELMKLWQNYQSVLFVDLPTEFEYKFIESFVKDQRNKMETVKATLTKEWHEQAADILRKELDNIPAEPPELRNSFFEAIATLMSNQARSLVESSILAYADFFKKYKKDHYPTAVEVASRKYDIGSPIERSFLQLTLEADTEKGLVRFKEPPHNVETQLMNVVEEVVKQSQSLPRAENMISSGENKQLWRVSMDDVLVKQALTIVGEIIQENLRWAKQVLGLYKEYEYILTEKTRLAKFLADKTKTREDYKEQIAKYVKQKDDIIANLKCEVRMNMFLVDCREINEKLLNECSDLIAELENTIAQDLKERANKLLEDYEEIHKKLNQKLDTEEILVETEQFLNQLKEVKKDEFVGQYQDLLQWLLMLLSTSFKVSVTELDKVKAVLVSVKSLNSILDSTEERLRNERSEFERKLDIRKQNVNNQLEVFVRELDKFKDRDVDLTGEKSNSEVLAGLGEVLTKVKADIVDINDKETIMGETTPTEYPKIPQLEEMFNNFQKLWLLVKQVETTTRSWANSLIFDLDPEIVKGKCEEMFKGASTLYGKLAKSFPKPAKKAGYLREKMNNFNKNADLIESLCNKDLKDRHWKGICEVFGFKEINKEDKKYTLSYFESSDVFRSKEKMERLKDIAQRATQEASNEKALNDMIALWEEQLFQTKEWKKTGTYVLVGANVDEILILQEEHLLKTQTMKGSPFAEVIKSRIVEWEQWLDRTAKIIEEWKKLQSSWTSLESVFTSEDILQQLPVEGALFREVDKAWRGLMHETYTEQKVKKIMANEKLKEMLEQCNSKLEQVNKRLNDYLETKRLAFCRFFFLGNEQLLQILSDAKEPLKVQEHVGSCFDGIGLLDFTGEKKIKGMISKEGEKVDFVSVVDPAKYKGMVELWLSEVEEQMMVSIKDSSEKGMNEYTTMKREDCKFFAQGLVFDNYIGVMDRPGQTILCVAMLFWTKECEDAMRENGVAGLKEAWKRQDKQLEGIVKLVRGDLKKLQRTALEALITLDVHAKDVTQDLIKSNVNDTSEFSWLAQLRYYWEDSNVWVKMVNATLEYNYEYVGNTSRLVITPLTDRCYRTLCGAINLNYGGAPEGPAGTGKTETVKDLSKALARQCIVFNCSDTIATAFMAQMFKGLASCGAWSCFDEFNRIELEVLSVIAQQLMAIQQSIAEGKKELLFEGTTIKVKPTCNCFITFNPGYAGRSELPDNLKALFRTVAMMVPDYAMISEIRLYAFGFTHARNLARKIVTTYKLCSEQLSIQRHYDYGMRAVMSVLVAAGNLKRKEPEQDENILVLRAISDVNTAKFLAPDLPLFQAITSDLFPGVVLPKPDYGHLEAAMLNQIEALKLKNEDYFREKIIQIYEMIIVRHGLMVVGLPYSGKTCALTVLEKALTELGEKNLMDEMKVKTQRLNPKSIDIKQLYGNYDEMSKEFTDGVLSAWFKKFSKSSKTPKRKWLIFDGPVDAKWIENMNTVLDDTKKLCLINGDTIPLTNGMNMIFEPMDLEEASPATVSRCGMIYMEPHRMGWRPLYHSWKLHLIEDFNSEKLFGDKALQIPTEWIEEIDNMMNELVPTPLKFLRSKLKESAPTQDQNLVQSLLNILRVQLGEMVKKDFVQQREHKVMIAAIQSAFLYAFIWSVCASISRDRKMFDMEIKRFFASNKKYSKVLPTQLTDATIYDATLLVSKDEVSWKSWVQLREEPPIPPRINPQEIIVTTVDTIRYAELLQMFIENELSSLYVGPTGTGKSVYVKNTLLTRLSQNKYRTVEIGFSAQTSAIMTQELIEGKLETRRKEMGPPVGTKCVIFVDDLNMPKKEQYGAQPPIELLRQYKDQGGWFNLKKEAKDKPFMLIKETLLIAAMGEPGGGRTFITPRFQRHFNVIAFAEFDDNTMKKIFSKILDWYFSNNRFATDIVTFVPKIVAGTLDIYGRVSRELRPTPLRSHYTFNLRDFSKVILGICLINKDHLPGTDVLIRLWAHETLRVFGDRLINDEDRLWMLGALKESVRKTFGVSFDTVFAHLDTDRNGKIENIDEIRGLQFGDILAPFGTTIRPYEELKDPGKVQTACDDALEQYNLSSSKPMNIVMFSFATEHLLRISRILKQPGGNALLVGVGGSGRQSLTKLAATITDFVVKEIEITKGYGKNEWHEDMKDLMKKAGGEAANVVFLFTDNQIKNEVFLEDINNILNIGEIPNLFPADEKAEVCEKVRAACRQEKKVQNESLALLYSYFIERCKKLLHIVLCFSPIGDAFRERIRNFPSLVNCCNIDWFSEWPTDGLYSVAKRFLLTEETREVPEDIKNGCIEMCRYMHESTKATAVEFKRQLKRYYYITPSAYLELINTFRELLAIKREEVKSKRDKYVYGHDCLVNTEASVKDMEKEMTNMKPELEAQNKACGEKKAILEVENANAEKQKNIVAADEAVVNENAQKANAIQTECKAELDKVMPELNKAKKALDNITPKDMTEIKALMKAPPKLIQKVMKVLMIFLLQEPEKKFNVETGKNKLDYWPVAKAKLLNPDFMKEFKTHDVRITPEKVINLVKSYTGRPTMDDKLIEGASKVVKVLWDNIKSMVKFYEVDKSIEPKRKKLNEAQAEADKLNAKLSIKRAALAEIQAKVDELSAQLKEQTDKKDDLQRRFDDCCIKLERARILVVSLKEEKERWSIRAKELEEEYTYVTGDAILSAAMIAYAGAFTMTFREELSKNWWNKCKELKIPCSPKFTLNVIMGDPVKLQLWKTQNLPSDSFSLDNAIIVTKSRRWPLCIDPQNQANRWIKAMERENNVDIIKFNDSNYMRRLENCVEFGIPLILEHDQTEIEPAINPVLLKQYVKKGSMCTIRIGDKTINYSTNFRLYITTKLRNPHYLPELTTKVTLINFMITFEGLKDQLLAEVVALERKELQQKKEDLVKDRAMMEAEQAKLEDSILTVISNSENILQDESAIKVLSDSKALSKTIATKQEIAKKTEAEIDEAREQYLPVAEKSSKIFFCITDLANIDPMYQYSLVFFITQFQQSIDNSRKDEDTPIEERTKDINVYFTYAIYSNICRSLFEKDKLLFSFLLAIRLEELQGKINAEEFRFLLTGGIALDEKYGTPPASWVSTKAWGEICRLSRLPSFEGFSKEFAAHVSEFKKIYDSQQPHEEKLPRQWNSLNMLQKMLVLRTIRPDKLIPASQNFISQKLGKEFVEAPRFDLEAVYKDSTCLTPLIFVLSPGADPFENLKKFANTMGKTLRFESLGQGRGDKAKSLINNAKEEGSWVLLQNCHLATSWMPELEKLCEDMLANPRKVNRDFRLWLTSYPSDRFPVSVLQNGIKMTNEAPKGLKNNLRKSLNINPINDPEFFNTCQKDFEFKKLMFGLIFFNAVIQERRKYGPLGWNIPYEFTESDLRISVRQLKMFIDQYPSKVPFEALRYLTGECNFGGRVTDDKDRRLILTILDDYYTDEIFKKDYKFSPSGIYYSPEPSSDRKFYEDYVDSFPLNPSPEVYGFHENADITKDIKETNLLLSSILLTQSASTGKLEKTFEETMNEIAENILSDFPKRFDLKKAEEKYPVLYEESMNTVLTQELNRYNVLMKVITTSLEDLQKALKGEVLLSQELEECMMSLFDMKVPDMWMKKSYPSLKPLGSYISDLKQRIVFFDNWVEQGIPNVFWISKFHFTQGFLTGAKQNYARKKKIPIDELDFDFQVIEEENPPTPEDGVNVTGMFLEGAKWDLKEKVLGESDPKVLHVKCPVVWLIPRKSDQLTVWPHYSCPVYRTSLRRGELSTTGHSTNFVMFVKLPSNAPASHWIKRGVALLVQLDDQAIILFTLTYYS